MILEYSPPKCPGSFIFGITLMSSGISFSNPGCKIALRSPTAFNLIRISYSNYVSSLPVNFSVWKKKNYVWLCELSTQVPLGSVYLPLSPFQQRQDLGMYWVVQQLCRILVGLICRLWYKFYLSRPNASNLIHISPEGWTACCTQAPPSTNSASKGGRPLSGTDLNVPWILA